MDPFKRIVELLAEGESFVLATIVSRSGSAPRAVGTRMILRRDGSIFGSVGGGILEAEVQALARDVFTAPRAVLRKFVLTAEDASRMGMICGGQVKVLLQFVDASDSSTVALYRETLAAVSARKRAWLVTELPAEDHQALGQHLWGSGGTLAGSMDAALVQRLTGQVGAGQPQVVDGAERSYLVECLCHEGCVFIFGAGHISQQFAPLASLVGFQTVVLDDRAEFANRERFPVADDLLVLPSFEAAFDGLEINEDSYLVLVTRGHAHDQTLLGQALRTPAGYIGMIGSRRKRDAIYLALEKEGFSPQDFERVRSPVGLAIGAETPEEIAVSIVAELIQARAGKNS